MTRFLFKRSLIVLLSYRRSGERNRQLLGCHHCWQSCQKTCVPQITKQDLQAFDTFLIEDGNEDRTRHNRELHVVTFLATKKVVGRTRNGGIYTEGPRMMTNLSNNGTAARRGAISFSNPACAVLFRLPGLASSCAKTIASRPIMGTNTAHQAHTRQSLGACARAALKANRGSPVVIRGGPGSVRVVKFHLLENIECVWA